tara:strand:- start:7691 stop:7915 length:225 start_codon:yes stop_codon:yes gene_type:complete
MQTKQSKLALLINIYRLKPWIFNNGKINYETGRPHEYDSEEALDIATQLFWRKGYDGTSLNELLKAMKISKGSL